MEIGIAQGLEDVSRRPIRHTLTLVDIVVGHRLEAIVRNGGVVTMVSHPTSETPQCSRRTSARIMRRDDPKVRNRSLNHNK